MDLEQAKIVANHYGVSVNEILNSVIDYEDNDYISDIVAVIGNKEHTSGFRMMSVFGKINGYVVCLTSTCDVVRIEGRVKMDFIAPSIVRYLSDYKPTHVQGQGGDDIIFNERDECTMVYAY